MQLCDIGNSFVKLYDNGKIISYSFEEFAKFKPKKQTYFINVNPKIRLDNDKFIDMSGYFMDFKTKYIGLGIDRIAGCYTIKDGVVVDVGTAITVDIMENGVHVGGFILPGINATLEQYRAISPALFVHFNSSVDINLAPQTTANAISYGIINSVVLCVEKVAKDKAIYFTGGDGHFFCQFFKRSIYDKALIFRGMIKALNERGIE